MGEEEKEKEEEEEKGGRDSLERDGSVALYVCCFSIGPEFSF